MPLIEIKTNKGVDGKHILSTKDYKDYRVFADGKDISNMVRHMAVDFPLDDLVTVNLLCYVSDVDIKGDWVNMNIKCPICKKQINHSCEEK